MKLKNIRYVGVNDHDLDLFEGQYPAANGMAYNSYVILDEKIAVMDSVSVEFAEQWLSEIRRELGERSPDYLIVQHMEPDHSGSILHFMQAYPDVKIVASARAFAMIKNFFGMSFGEQKVVVGDGDTLSLGKRELTFISAMMVHWPEVIMTYDNEEKVLFSADAFGSFGALDVETEDWISEARRYYMGIVGKYGAAVQPVLKKIAALDVQTICSLHGPVLTDDVKKYIELYHIWSSFLPEEEGVTIAYTSIYGNTKKAALLLAEKLREKGQTVAVYDLARSDVFAAVADAFRYSKLVLATTTYNGNIFPAMSEFLYHLAERGYQNRTVGFVENGSWAPVALRWMKKRLEKCNGLRYLQNEVSILSALNESSMAQLMALAEELCEEKMEE